MAQLTIDPRSESWVACSNPGVGLVFYFSCSLKTLSYIELMFLLLNCLPTLNKYYLTWRW